MANKSNPNSRFAQSATASLAGQAHNFGKGFDATKIESMDPAIIENIVTLNDLSVLTPKQQTEYIKMLCESLGLNPLSKPLQLIWFDDNSTSDKKKTLRVYATRDCTDQLRTIRGVSVETVEKEMIEDIFFVTVYVKDRDGRTDVATGAVAMKGFKQGGGEYQLTGQNKANAMMKAETKAKRRATLSICGLGFLDESEIDNTPGASSQPLPTSEETGSEETVELTFDYVAQCISEASTLDELYNVHDNILGNYNGPDEDALYGIINNRAEELKGQSGEEEAQTGADALAQAKELIDGAKTRPELDKIYNDHIQYFKPEAIKKKFIDMLNAKREEIRRSVVNEDTNKAATSNSQGLFKKKN